jgi:hypothetical protein
MLNALPKNIRGNQEEPGEENESVAEEESTAEPLTVT